MSENLTEKNGLAIRRMRDVDSDYALMLKWLTDDRVLEYYGGRDKKYTMESIKQKYSPRILGKESAIPCIIEYQEKPIGYIQFYNDRKPDDIFDDIEGVFGVDLFIGEPVLWREGLGSRTLRMMAEYLFENTAASKIIIDPDVSNVRAIRAYEKAGFHKVKIIPGYELHEGKRQNAWLMVCERPTKNYLP